MSGEVIQLDVTKVGKAVEALRQISSTVKKDKELLDKVEEVELQICLKKIPPKEKTIKLKLPHSIKKPDAEVCLFVKDLDRKDREYEATVQHFQDILKKKGVTSISEIIPLKSLKTEYKPFEAKRNLSNAFDLFLADARIIRFLPSLLGKQFYGRKKAPVQVNLQTKNIASEVEAAISNSRCPVTPKGSVSTAVVGHLQMKDKEVTENVIASAAQISEKIGGGSINIKLLGLKLKKSTSIPIYLSTGGPQDVKIIREKVSEPVEAEEISTVFGAKVKVFPSGHIKVIKDGAEDEVASKSKKPKLSSHQKSSKKKGVPVKKKVAKKELKKKGKKVLSS